MYLEILRDSVFHLDTLLMTRSLAKLVAFDIQYRRGQDFDFFLQLVQAAKIAQIDAVYASYRQHEASVTNRPHLRNFRAEVTQAARDRWGLTDADGREMTEAEFRHLLARSWFSHGWQLYEAEWYLAAAKSFSRCLAMRPLHLRSAAYLLRCLWRRRADRMPTDVRPL